MDTNVLVSAALTHSGRPAEVLGLILDDRIELVVDDRVLDEYRRVLMRSELDITREEAEVILDYLDRQSHRVQCLPSPAPLPHQADECFLAAAAAGKAAFLITANTRLFPPGVFGDVRVATPAEFLAAYVRIKHGPGSPDLD